MTLTLLKFAFKLTHSQTSGLYHQSANMLQQHSCFDARVRNNLPDTEYLGKTEQ